MSVVSTSLQKNELEAEIQESYTPGDSFTHLTVFEVNNCSLLENRSLSGIVFQQGVDLGWDLMKKGKASREKS